MDIAKKDFPQFADAEIINTIKNEAFKHGILDEDIYSIFGVFLRDYILKTKGIAVSDVDKFTPKE
ncbi:MAG: hypothetical protein LBP38_00240 [Desulfovibrio sp.]|jgi:hypothetical protein|nr:hypothetical protein [Desulfovibrio sp.]